MNLHRASNFRVAMLALIGVCLLAIAAIPSGVERAELPRTLSRLVPLRTYLKRTDRPALDPPPPGAPRALADFHRDAGAAADALDLSIRRLALRDRSLGFAARALRCIEDPAAEVDPPSVSRALSDGAMPPIRRIDRLGAVAEDVQRVSAENASRLPKDLLSAIADLVLAIERVDIVARKLRDDALGESPVRVSLEAIEASLLATEPDVAVAAALPGLVARVDLGAWQDASIELADAVDRVRDTLALHRASVLALRPLPDGSGVPRNLVFASTCAAGLVLIGGKGPTVMPLRGVALAIDFDGSDTWHSDASLGDAPADEAVASIAIDLDGGDRWSGTRFGPCAARGGVAIVADLGGADFYESTGAGLGCAVLGSALLFDAGGDDHYDVGLCGLGFGALGIGAVIDADGDDVWQAHRAALGAGACGGFGCVVDLGGDDLYITDLPADAIEPECTAGAASAIGGFGYAIGILIDRSGSDSFRLGRGGGGAASGGGLGFLLDAGGNDLHAGAERCFGSGRGAGTGIFRDLEGDDEYLARGFSLGCGAGGIGAFIDDAGRDHALALEPSRGAELEGGLSIYADVGAPGTAKPRGDSRGRRR